MLPSETTRGRAWLTNFSALDQPSMRLLIDSLQIASPSQTHVGVRTQLELLETNLQDGTGLLLPVLSIEDLERSLAELARLNSPTPLESSAQPGTRGRSASGNVHTAWETYQPGMPILSTPGSEGATGNLIRELTGDRPGREPSCWLHPASSIATLRRQHCRLVVLVTDYSGSGRQVVEFARTILRNPRIRSWRSLGWLRVAVASYAISQTARAAIVKSGFIDQISVTVPAQSLNNAPWTDGERKEIERVCRQYAPRRQRNSALGHKGSGGLFMTHISVPNNLPKVLSRQPPGWQPFLDGPTGRIVPRELIEELADFAPSHRDPADIAEAANQLRLSRALKSGRLRAPADQLLALLALLAHRNHAVLDLSRIMGLSETQLQAMVAFLEHVGFLSEDLTVTKRGRDELKNSKRLKRIATAGLDGSQDPYYPQSLR